MSECVSTLNFSFYRTVIISGMVSDDVNKQRNAILMIRAAFDQHGDLLFTQTSLQLLAESAVESTRHCSLDCLEMAIDANKIDVETILAVC
jgi:hypothetical protein